MIAATDLLSRPPTILGLYLLLGLIVGGACLAVRAVWLHRRSR